MIWIEQPLEKYKYVLIFPNDQPFSRYWIFADISKKTLFRNFFAFLVKFTQKSYMKSYIFEKPSTRPIRICYPKVKKIKITENI